MVGAIHELPLRLGNTSCRNLCYLSFVLSQVGTISRCIRTCDTGIKNVGTDLLGLSWTGLKIRMNAYAPVPTLATLKESHYCSVPTKKPVRAEMNSAPTSYINPGWTMIVFSFWTKTKPGRAPLGFLTYFTVVKITGTFEDCFA